MADKGCVQVSEVVKELAAGGSAVLGVKLDENLVERLCAYSRSVASFPTAIKEVWFIASSQLS